MYTFIYKLVTVSLMSDFRKKKPIFNIYINGHYISFVSNIETAKRIACNFIDIIQSPKHFIGRTKPTYKPKLTN